MSRSESIDLGLAVAHVRLAKRGVPVPHKLIAAYCGCTWQSIYCIEQKALHKLKRRAYLVRDSELLELS